MYLKNLIHATKPDKLKSFSQEEKDEMKAKMRNINIFQFIDISNDILEKIKSAKNT